MFTRDRATGSDESQRHHTDFEKYRAMLDLSQSIRCKKAVKSRPVVAREQVAIV
jgi:hypothetical protein